MNQEEIDQEVLECARYGEDDELRQMLAAGGNVNFKDMSGNTALHRASANGHVPCLIILKEFDVLHLPNNENNFPAHWAAQNGKWEALTYLLENFEIDVLAQNSSGRSILTEAFQSKEEKCIEVCLSHKSATEERLIGFGGKAASETIVEGNEEEEENNDSGDSPNAKDSSSSNIDVQGVIHHMRLSPDLSLPVIAIRELPIQRADYPFGTETQPELDTTGLSIWPASIILARWIATLGKEYMENKHVLELGAGTGLPIFTAAQYCPSSSGCFYYSDINEASIENARYIQRSLIPDQTLANQLQILTLSWSHSSSSQVVADHSLDLLLGSDLVYDTAILDLLVPTITRLLKAETGEFLYVAPNTGRAGMSEFVRRCEESGIRLIECFPATEGMYANPLVPAPQKVSPDDASSIDLEDQFVLHFYDLAAKEPHTCYRFRYLPS